MESSGPIRTSADYAIMWLRLLFGAHLIYSGMRHVLGFEMISGMTHPVGGPFVRIIAEMGMYQFIKWVELAVGVLLVCNRLVPLVLIIELPISVVIFWLNTIIVQEPRQLYSGTQEVVLNSAMILLYGRYYLPLLNWKAPARPLWHASLSEIQVPLQASRGAV